MSWTGRPGPWPLVARCAAGFFCLAVPSAAAPQELDGRVRETYQALSNDRDRTRSLLQNYEITFRNDVTSALYWQARLRALLTGLDGGGESSTDTRLTEPFLQVVYEGPEWQASGGGRLTSVTPRGDQSDLSSSRREDLFGHLAWGREEAPRADWSVYRIALKSEGIETSTEDRSLLSASWTRGPGGLALGLENRWFTDHRTDFTRDSVQVTGNGDLRGTLGGGRLVIGGQALAVEGRTREETPRALEVDVLRRPRRGLFAADPTPLTGALGDLAGLVDGDPDAPVPADLNGDFRNIGVELGFAERIDTVFLHLERDFLQPDNASEYRWDVYISDDGDRWDPHAAGAGVLYDALQRRFEIRFVETSTRWLKIVNTLFSADEGPLALTEIQVSGRELRSGRERTAQSLQSGNLNVSWRPSRSLDVGFYAFANRQATETDGDRRADEDLNATLSGALRPGVTATTVRLQAVNRSSALGRPEADRIASVTFAATPLPALDLSVTGTHRRNTSRGTLLVEADSIDFRGAARVAGDVEAALDLGLIHQDEAELDRTTTRRRGGLFLVSTLRPGLIVSNIWSAERITFGGPAGASAPARTDLDLRSRMSYRPTRVLGAAIEILYQDIGGSSGFARLYDLDWLPFPGGALQVQLSFRQDRRSITGELREETRGGLRWTVNPQTLLDLAYTVVKLGSEDADRQQVVSAFLEYRF